VEVVDLGDRCSDHASEPHTSWLHRLQDFAEATVEEASATPGVDHDPVGVDHDPAHMTEEGEGDQQSWIDGDAFDRFGPA
jgi:hypothetical protein